MNMQSMYWSVRRELWENRSVYLAPLIVAAVVLFASMITTLTLPVRMRAGSGFDAAKMQTRIVKPINMAPAPIMFTTFIIAFFYSIDALYGERRDRSILFWKSLPVSDLTTVLSKAAIPMGVLPLIGFVLGVASQIVLLPLSTMVLLGSGVSPVGFWADFRFFEGLFIMLYGLFVHVLWFAPIYGWLLLISAWAKRAPILWAVLPLLAISAVERILFNTWFFMRMLQYRMTGAMRQAFILTKGPHATDQNFDRFSQLDPVNFLTTPGLWVGLILAAVFLGAAVRLRRYREPI